MIHSSASDAEESSASGLQSHRAVASVNDSESLQGYVSASGNMVNLRPPLRLCADRSAKGSLERDPPVFICIHLEHQNIVMIVKQCTETTYKLHTHGVTGGIAIYHGEKCH